MSLTVKANKESSFTPVPPGMHLARCYRVVDLGTQKSEYMGEIKHLPKVMVQFEVHGEDESGQPLVTAKGEPLSISKNYTASLSEKATLRVDLKNWRGRDFTPEELKGFELKNILGVWAMITVTKSPGRDGKEYTNIGAVMPVPANIKKAGLPEGVNATSIFSIADPDMAMFDSFSDNLKTKIQSSPEWQEREIKEGIPPVVDSHGAINKLDDDIPF